MLTKEQEQRQTIEMLCTDMLVPQDHLLRKIDAAVDFRHIYGIVENLYCKDSGRIPSLPYKRPMTKKGNLPWYEYVYDEYYDCVLCPQYQVLNYSTTNREGYREYKSKSYICKKLSGARTMHPKPAMRKNGDSARLAGLR